MIEERRNPVSPQVAIRVAYLGMAAFVILGVIFFRLWYLQVLAGDHNVAQARANRVRSERIPAPRGEIIDRNKIPIVTNRPASVVTLNPRSLPREYRDAILEWGHREGIRQRNIELHKPGARKVKRQPQPQPPPVMRALYKRLGGALQLSVAAINRKVVSSVVQVQYGDVSIKTDVPAAVRDYIREHQDRFPDVEVQQRFMRQYPYNGLAAQMIGITGEISEGQLGLRRFRGVTAGTVIGKEGLEYSYDRFLRGADGEYSIVVDSSGDRQGVRTARNPKVGSSLKLTLDLGLQQKAQRYFTQTAGNRAGAFVAMDPENGEILAMGSFPTYDPGVFSHALSKQRLNQIFGAGSGTPRFNRAVGGGYPIGSTFKPVTALAALDKQRIRADEVFTDTGCIEIGRLEADKTCNAGKQALGPLTLSRAITVSSNVFFTELALRLDRLPGQPLQHWARDLGYGRYTGIDLPGQAKGLVPDRAWRDAANKREAECRKRRHRPCGIADGTNRPWTTGDEVNLALGQGDMLASPLQVAVAYSAIANGGTIVRPHLGLQINDEEGRLLQRLDPGARRHIAIDPTALNVVREGLHGATVEGTSADVMANWPQDQIPLYGKTGTAQRPGKNDQAWYAVFTRTASRPIVIVTTVEDGGFGAETAAPIACRMLASWYQVKDMGCSAGKSHQL